MNKKAARKLKQDLKPLIQKHEKEKWKYFIPTDSHLLGFKTMLDMFDGNDVAYDELGSAKDGLKKKAKETLEKYSNKDRKNNYNDETFVLNNIQKFGSNSAVVTAVKDTGKLATFFFYYNTSRDNNIYKNKEWEIIDISPLSDETAHIQVQERTGTVTDFLFIWVGGCHFWTCFPVKQHIQGLQGCVAEERKVEKYNFEKNFREAKNQKKLGDG